MLLWEYAWILLPVFVVTTISFLSEYQQNRIPNFVTMTALAYFFVTRLMFGPQSFWLYLASFAMGVIWFVFGGFLIYGLGGGAAKLGAAICMAISPLYTFVFLLTTGFQFLILRVTRRRSQQSNFNAAGMLFFAAIAVVIYDYFYLAPWGR